MSFRINRGSSLECLFGTRWSRARLVAKSAEGGYTFHFLASFRTAMLLSVTMGRDPKLATYVAAPGSFLAAFLVFLAIYKLAGGPSQHELIALARRYFAEHGYWVVFLGAFGEGLLVANWYFPGSVVVVVGVVFCRQGALELGWVFTLIVLGFWLTALIDYCLGRYGWYVLFWRLGLERPLERTRQRLVQRGYRIVIIMYIHPNFGALAATGSGILRIPLLPFAASSLAGILFWNALWTGIAYLAGPSVLDLMDMRLLLPILLLWLTYSVIRYRRHLKLGLSAVQSEQESL